MDILYIPSPPSSFFFFFFPPFHSCIPGLLEVSVHFYIITRLMRHLHLSIICSILYILALSYLPESNIVIPASKHSQPARLSFIHVLLFLSLFISASPLSFVSFLPLKVILFFFFAPIIFSTSHTHPFVIEGVIYCQVYYLVIHYLHFCRLAAYWKFQTKF